jgi:hypothetical protein
MSEDVRPAAAIGAWLRAALDDPKAPAQMKDDIRAWFAAGEPNLQEGTMSDAEHHAAIQQALTTLYQAAKLAEAEGLRVEIGFGWEPAGGRGTTIFRLHRPIRPRG